MNVWEGADAFSEARAYCKLWGIEGPVLVDEHGALTDRLGIRGVPTNIVVDETGTVTAVGASTPPELEAAVRRLLGPDAPVEPAPGAKSWSWETTHEHIGSHVAKRIVDPKG